MSVDNKIKWRSFLSTYLLTYLLTQWCRVLLEKLTGFQLVKKFPAFYGNRRFITAVTSSRHLSLSWASSIQSIHTHPTSWRPILLLSSHFVINLLYFIRIRKWVYVIGIVTDCPGAQPFRTEILNKFPLSCVWTL